MDDAYAQVIEAMLEEANGAPEAVEYHRLS